MKKESIYLETSVISAYFDFKKQDPQRKKETRLFWNALDFYKPYVSDLVIEELAATSNKNWRDKFLDLITGLPRLSFSKEAFELGQRYLKAGLIPAAKRPDAHHFAIATLSNIDILVSWNYDHIANLEAERKIGAFNELHNYPKIITEFPSKLIIPKT